ncbi:MAG TPA: DNA-directed RNA polymerase subunit K [Candidatus Aenigmarchaeota archaeon]|nr:DNA-directed RNA polymerase subunit K [Candidatus Aenigmarchaeota archaeon]
MWPTDRLTRFEVARIVGARALQIALGAPVLVKLKKGEKFNPIELAKREFMEGIVPITVKRPLPTGEKVVIDIKKAIKNWIKEYGSL